MEQEVLVDVTVQCTCCENEIDDNTDIFCRECAERAFCSICEEAIDEEVQDIVCGTCYDKIEDDVRDELVEIHESLECITKEMVEIRSRLKAIYCKVPKRNTKDKPEKKKKCKR